MFDHWRAVAEQFGYQAYDSCVLEQEDLYIRKAGDEITQQLYNFRDKGDRPVALRPELTPSLARMVMARQGNLSCPYVGTQLANAFATNVCNVVASVSTTNGTWMSSVSILSRQRLELMAAQAECLRRLGIQVDGDQPELIFKVSDRRLLQGFLADLDIVDDRFAAVCVEVDNWQRLVARR